MRLHESNHDKSCSSFLPEGWPQSNEDAYLIAWHTHMNSRVDSCEHDEKFHESVIHACSGENFVKPKIFDWSQRAEPFVMQPYRLRKNKAKMKWDSSFPNNIDKRHFQNVDSLKIWFAICQAKMSKQQSDCTSVRMENKIIYSQDKQSKAIRRFIMFTITLYFVVTLFIWTVPRAVCSQERNMIDAKVKCVRRAGVPFYDSKCNESAWTLSDSHFALDIQNN